MGNPIENDDNLATMATSELRRLIDGISADPVSIVTQSDSVKSDALKTARLLYKLIIQQSSELNAADSNANSLLPELFVDGMDVEQIWAQIQLSNDYLFGSVDLAVDDCANLLQQFESSHAPSDSDSGDQMEDGEDMEEEEPDSEDENEEFHQEESEEDEFEGFPDSIMHDEEVEEQEVLSKEKVSPIDDEFFSLEQMENFADGQIVRNNRNAESDEEEEEQLGAEESDEEANIMFDDFFRAPRQRANTTSRRPATQKSFHESQQQEEEHESDTEEQQQPMNLFEIGEYSGDEQESMMTKHEQEMKRMMSSIKELEEENLRGRDWQLMGEVNALKRPENSLLEEHMEFDVASKPVPVITQEVTSSLEELIKQRIKDSMFDDVERKLAPSQLAAKQKELVELNESKPTQSLVQVYESEYQRQKDEAEGKQTQENMQKQITKEHVEIDAMFKDLCQKLDQLSNYHFKPMPIVADLSIKPKEVSSIEMEEAIPVAVTDSNLLAPQEVYAQKRNDLELKTQDDMTSEDKSKLRRQKKNQRAKIKRKAESDRKLVDRINPGLGNKHAKNKLIDEMVVAAGKSGSNITILGGKDRNNRAKLDPAMQVNSVKLKL